MSKVKEQLERIPRHLAIIMDGNGRWAKKRGLPRVAGHRAGTENIRRILEACGEYEIKILTIYAFSTENWGRPEEEVQGLMSIFSEFIDRETDSLHRQGVHIRHLGTLDDLSTTLKQKTKQALELTKDNERLMLNVALNYGGRAEIVQSIRRILAAGFTPDQITEQLIGDHLDTAGLPDPDFIIRTGGEMRLSNFLIWQAAYAEYYSTPVFWPDFDKKELHKALAAYNQRDRRYGLVKQL